MCPLCGGLCGWYQQGCNASHFVGTYASQQSMIGNAGLSMYAAQNAMLDNAAILAQFRGMTAMPISKIAKAREYAADVRKRKPHIQIKKTV